MLISNVTLTFNYIDKKLYLILFYIKNSYLSNSDKKNSMFIL